MSVTFPRVDPALNKKEDVMRAAMDFSRDSTPNRNSMLPGGGMKILLWTIACIGAAVVLLKAAEALARSAVTEDLACSDYDGDRLMRKHWRIPRSLRLPVFR